MVPEKAAYSPKLAYGSAVTITYRVARGYWTTGFIQIIPLSMILSKRRIAVKKLVIDNYTG